MVIQTCDDGMALTKEKTYNCWDQRSLPFNLTAWFPFGVGI